MASTTHWHQKGFRADEFDLDILWSNTNVVECVVEIGAVAIDAETSQRIEDRYGDGVVEVEAALTPVDQRQPRPRALVQPSTHRRRLLTMRSRPLFCAPVGAALAAACGPSDVTVLNCNLLDHSRI